jgi:hypothetical protein
VERESEAESGLGREEGEANGEVSIRQRKNCVFVEWLRLMADAETTQRMRSRLGRVRDGRRTDQGFSEACEYRKPTVFTITCVFPAFTSIPTWQLHSLEAAVIIHLLIFRTFNLLES